MLTITNLNKYFLFEEVAIMKIRNNKTDTINMNAISIKTLRILRYS